MVNGSRYYRAYSVASALSGALTINPCQIRAYQRWQSKLQLLLQLRRRSGGRPQRTVYPRRLPVNTLHCDTHYVTRHRIHNLPIVSLARYQ